MRAVFVVVLAVAAEHMLEVAVAEDENPVEAIGADGAHLACSPVGRVLDAVAADPLVLVPATDTVVVAASGSRCIRVGGAVVSAGAAASSAQLNSNGGGAGTAIAGLISLPINRTAVLPRTRTAVRRSLVRR